MKFATAIICAAITASTNAIKADQFLFDTSSMANASFMLGGGFDEVKNYGNAGGSYDPKSVFVNSDPWN